MKNAVMQQTRLAISAPLAVAALIAVFITSDALAAKPGGGASPTHTLISLGVPVLEFSDYAGVISLSRAGTLVGVYEPLALRTPAFNTRRGYLLVPEDTNGNGQPDRWYRDGNGDGENDLLVDLGVPPDYATVDPISIDLAAYDINAAGQVVLNAAFYIYLGSDTWQMVDSAAYLLNPTDVNGDGKLEWFAPDVNGANALMTRIGPRAANCADFVTPVAINNAGQIVGHCAGRGFLVYPMDANGDGVADTWFQDTNGDGINDLVVDLGVAPPADFNDSGWVIGSSPRPWVLIPRRDPSSDRQIWNEDANGDGVNDRVVTLPLLSGIGGDVASSINKDGVVVGLCSWKPTGWSGRYAVLWRVEAQGRATLTNLGLKWSVASGINANQQVVGSYNDGHGSSAFLWQNGVMSDLRNLIQPGAIPSTWPLSADEINDLRMILGSYGATTKQKYYIAVPNSLLR